MATLSVAIIALTYLLPVLLVIGGLIALYWIVRRAVAAGIRDARSDGGPDRSA